MALKHLYLVELTYPHPAEKFWRHLQAHQDYLNRMFEQDRFLAYGPKASGNGSVILVRGDLSRDELQALLAADPFHQFGVAVYRVTEFSPFECHPRLASLF